MDAKASDAAVAAIRASTPGLPVGLSTSAAIDPDPFARAAAITAWRQQPDFVAVDVSEVGWAGIARTALRAGISVEAALSAPADAEELRRSPSHTRSSERSSKLRAALTTRVRSPNWSPMACCSSGTAPANGPGRSSQPPL